MNILGYDSEALFGNPYHVWVTRNGKWRLVHASGNRAYAESLVERFSRAYPDERISVRHVSQGAP